MVNKEAYSNIFGNKSVIETLLGFTQRRAFPHAIIFSGPKGSGKKTLALFAAMSVACLGENKPCLSCEACRKIQQGICPDIISVGLQKDKKTIGVEAVRHIRETVHRVPNDLSVKIYMLSDADKMTVQAQNALLKLFEEPPNGVYFFLMCSSTAELLPTVRSRAPELRTEIFGEETLLDLLSENVEAAAQLKKTSPEVFRRLLHLSGGSYGMAKQLVAENSSKLLAGFDETEGLLYALCGSDRSELLLKMNLAASSREQLIALISQLILALRDMTAVKKTSKFSSLLFFGSRDTAVSFSERFSLSVLLKLYRILVAEAEKLSGTNVNASTTALVLADRLWEAK